MTTALVFIEDGNGLDYVDLCLKSIRRVGIRLPDVFTVTPEAVTKTRSEGDIRRIGLRALADKTGISDITGENGFRPAQAYLALLPLLTEFSSFDHLLVIESGILVESRDFSVLFSYPCRDYEAVAAAGDLSGCRKPLTDYALAAQILRGEIYDRMSTAIWSRNPLETRAHVQSGLCLLNLEIIRERLRFYEERVAAFIRYGRSSGGRISSELFMNLFLDTAALLDSPYHVLPRDGIGVPANRGSVSVDFGCLASDRSRARFTDRAGELGLLDDYRPKTVDGVVNGLSARSSVSSYRELILRREHRNWSLDHLNACDDVSLGIREYVNGGPSRSLDPRKSDPEGDALVVVRGFRDAEHVARDFKAALDFVGTSGFVVVPDTCLEDNRPSLVGRAVLSVLRNYAVPFYTVPIPGGCTVISATPERRIPKSVDCSNELHIANDITTRDLRD